METNEIKGLISLVEQILKRPGMFGINNVEELYFLLLGYSFAEKKEIDMLNGFREYVNKEFIPTHFEKDQNIDYNWPKWIRFYSNTDFETLKLFSKLFNGYLSTLNTQT